VQDVDASPALVRERDGSREGSFCGDVRLEGHALSAFRRHQGGCLLGRGQVPVDRQYPRSFTCEAQNRSAAVAHTFPGTLTGSDNDRNLRFETHGGLFSPWADLGSSVFVGADTVIGPLYLAAGYAEGGNYALYLFLGRR
jgi:hypothetical protein